MRELLQRVVRLHGVQIGHVLDVFLDPTEGGPIGLEVRCEDGKHRFLPMSAGTSIDGEVVIGSPFALLDTDELEFYRKRSVALRSRREPAA